MDEWTALEAAGFPRYRRSILKNLEEELKKNLADVDSG
jgi:hypothetical protein